MFSESFPNCYELVLKKYVLDHKCEKVISELSINIIELSKELFYNESLGENVSITYIGIMGSSSRHTYISPPVDFDLLISTNISQKQIDKHKFREQVKKLVLRITETEKFKNYLELLDANLSTTKISITKFEKRGMEPFVARFNLENTGQKNPFSTTFLDINLGKLPQLESMGHWGPKIFGCLESTQANRLRSEIRLARHTIESTCKLHFGKTFKVPGFLIEALIIYSTDYKKSDVGIGTLHNALLLIYSDTQKIAVEGAAKSAKSFGDRFPIYPVGYCEGWRQNKYSYNYLESGNIFFRIAEIEKGALWVVLVGLSNAYTKLLRDNDNFSVPELIDHALVFIKNPHL